MQIDTNAAYSHPTLVFHKKNILLIGYVVMLYWRRILTKVQKSILIKSAHYFVYDEQGDVNKSEKQKSKSLGAFNEAKSYTFHYAKGSLQSRIFR